MNLLFLLIALSIALIALLVFRPSLTATSGGKIMAFVILFGLPILCLGMGLSAQLQNSKTTRFCLSCHIMEPYGQSLHVDDPGHLAANHFQNHRVPPDEACYTCHTHYAMFGGLKVKLNGLRHIYVYYFGNAPKPADIKLYEPYSNRECLHCHAGARSFEEGAAHAADPTLLSDLKSNKTSCLTCHQVVHDVATLGEQKYWKGAN